MGVFLELWEQKRLLLGVFLLPAAWLDLADIALAEVERVGHLAVVGIDDEAPNPDFLSVPYGGNVDDDFRNVTVFSVGKETSVLVFVEDKDVDFVTGVGTGDVRSVGDGHGDAQRVSERGAAVSSVRQTTLSANDFGEFHNGVADVGNVDVLDVLFDEHGTLGNGSSITEGFETLLHGRGESTCHFGDVTELCALSLLRGGAGIAGTAVVDGEYVEGAPLATDGVTEFVANGAEIASEINCHNFLFFRVNV